MKLFMLHERTGYYTQTLYKPKLPTAEQEEEIKKEIEIEKAGIHFPPETGTKWGPSHNLVAMWAGYLMRIAITVLNLHDAKMYAWVNAWLQRWATKFVIGAKLGAAFYYVSMIAFAAILLYIVNPSTLEDGGISHYPDQYVGVYQGKMWFFDLQAISGGGEGLYFNCGLIPGQIFQHTRNIRWIGKTLDEFSFHGTWTYLWHDTLQWRYYVWNTAFAEYIGVMSHIVGSAYMLRKPVTDPYLAEAPRPWLKPVYQHCYKHFTIP